MIFPFPTPVYVVGAAGFWLKNGAYAENEKQRLLMLALNPVARMRENLKAMHTVNDGLRFRALHTHAEAQLTA